MALNKRLQITLRWAFYAFLLVTALLLLLAIVLLKPLDHTPYQQSAYYHKTCEEIAAIPPIATTQGDTMKAGWARVNLQPSFRTPIAIDANRKGKCFESVHDSLYVRAFVFHLGSKKVAYISADLLIIPPVVAKVMDTLMKAEGFDLHNIYLTATHTHTGIGAWHPSFIGEVFAGKYDARVPSHIADCMQRAILEADKHCEKVKMGYVAVPTHKLVVKSLGRKPWDGGFVD